MTEKIRVAILGAGTAGTGHARAYTALPNVEVVGVWSPTGISANQLAANLNHAPLQVYDQWADLIEQSGADVISVATPETLRLEPVTMALALGKHVLVEKPFSINIESAQAMYDAAKQAKTVNTISFNWRYAPSCQAALREIQEDRIGPLIDIRLEWRFAMSPRAILERWLWDQSANGSNGLLAGGGSHEFDRACFLTGSTFQTVTGRVTPVSFSNEPTYQVENGAYMLLAELSNGVLGHFRFTPTTGLNDWRLFIHGERGSLEVDTTGPALRRKPDQDQPKTLAIPEADQVPDGVEIMQHTWNRLIADFITAIRRGDVDHKTLPNLPTFADGLHNQAVISAARRAEDERRWVALAEI